MIVRFTERQFKASLKEKEKVKVKVKVKDGDEFEVSPATLKAGGKLRNQLHQTPVHTSHTR